MGNAVVNAEEFNRRLTEWLIEYNFLRAAPDVQLCVTHAIHPEA